MDEPELERDRMIEAALNRLQDPSARTEAEWNRLQQRIVLAAASRLLRRSRKKGWVDQTASWARAAIPIGLAAGLAALLLIRHAQMQTQDATGGSAPSFLLAVTQEDAERELVEQAIGASSGDWMISAAATR